MVATQVLHSRGAEYKNVNTIPGAKAPACRCQSPSRRCRSHRCWPRHGRHPGPVRPHVHRPAFVVPMFVVPVFVIPALVVCISAHLVVAPLSVPSHWVWARHVVVYTSIILVKERKKRKERKTNLQAQEVLPTSPAPPVWSPLQLRCHGRPLSFLPSLWLPPLLLAASLVLSCSLPSFGVIPLGLHGYRMRTAAVVHRAVHRKFAGDNSI